MPTKETFSLKEIVMEMRDDLKELKEIMPDHMENTAFRKKAMYAIVGTAFSALAALGVMVLKTLGIVRF